jgi:alanyl-tRNA synthetase
MSPPLTRRRHTVSVLALPVSTLQAGAFAVIEEASIAKGIRRIVAFTRQAAIDAQGAAEALRDEFGTTRALPVERLGEVLLALQDKLAAAVIPAAARLDLRRQLEDLQAKSLEHWKAAQRARSDAAVASLMAEAEVAQAAAVSSGKPKFIVRALDIGDDAKLANKVATAVTKACSQVAVLVVCSGDDKIVVVSSVPDSLVAAGFKATDWVSTTMSAVGGRGGGKDGSAQGQVADPAKAAIVIDAARQFAEKALA